MAPEVEAALLRNASFIHGLARKWVPADEADDLRQDIWLAALQRPPREGTLPAWLASTSRRLAARAHRSEYRRQQIRVISNCGETVARETSDVVSELEAHERVLNAVTNLPVAYRDPIVLKYYEGLETKEIAERLGLSHVNVRARLWRGVAILRSKLEPSLRGYSGAIGGVGSAALASKNVATHAGSALSLGGLLIMPAKLTIALGLFVIFAFSVVLWPDSREPIPANKSSVPATVDPRPRHPAAVSETSPMKIHGEDEVRVPIDDGEDPKVDSVQKHEAVVNGLPEPGLVTFRPVDGTTSEPLFGVQSRFMSEDRFGEINLQYRANLTPGLYALGIVAPGYNPVVIEGVEVLSGEHNDLGDVALRPGTGAIAGRLFADHLSASTDVQVELHGRVVLRCTECHSGTPHQLEQWLKEVGPDGNEAPGCQRNYPTLDIFSLRNGARDYRFEGLAEGTYYLRAAVKDSLSSDVRTVRLQQGERRRGDLKLEGTAAVTFHVTPPDREYWQRPGFDASTLEIPFEEEEEEPLVFRFRRDRKVIAVSKFTFENAVFSEEETEELVDEEASDRVDRARQPGDVLIPEFEEPTFDPIRITGTFLEPSTFVIEPLPMIPMTVDVYVNGYRAHPIRLDFNGQNEEVTVSWRMR